MTNDSDPRDALPNPMDSGLYRVIPLAAVILGFAAVSMYYGEIPDDGAGSKIALWALPVLNLALFILMGRLANWKNYDYWNYPVRITPENKVRQHRLALRIVAETRLLSCLLLSFAAYEAVLEAAGRPDPYGETVILVLVGVLIALLIFRLVQARRLA